MLSSDLHSRKSGRRRGYEAQIAAILWHNRREYRLERLEAQEGVRLIAALFSAAGNSITFGLLSYLRFDDVVKL